MLPMCGNWHINGYTFNVEALNCCYAAYMATGISMATFSVEIMVVATMYTRASGFLMLGKNCLLVQLEN